MKIIKTTALALLCLCGVAMATDRVLFNLKDAAGTVVFQLVTDDAGVCSIICGTTTNIVLTSGGTTLPTTSLASGKMFIGATNGAAYAVTPSGLFTMATTGVSTAVSGAMPLSGIATGIPANILIYGSNTSLSQQALSGDATIATNGALTIGDHKITTNSMPAIEPGYIIVGGHNSNATIAAMSGDVTINSNAVTTIGASKVIGTMITNGAITGDKIAGNTVSNSSLQNGNWYITGMSTTQVAHIEYGTFVGGSTQVYTRAFTLIPQLHIYPSSYTNYGPDAITNLSTPTCMSNTYFQTTNCIGVTQMFFAVGS